MSSSQWPISRTLAYWGRTVRDPILVNSGLGNKLRATCCFLTDEFRRKFKNPILAGREPDSSQPDKDKAKVLQNEMSTIVNQFILRRTNTINAKFLPDKLVQIVCCRLTKCQEDIYHHLISSKDVTAALNGQVKDALSYIQNLQKLCNHPKILEMSGSGKTKGISKEELQLHGVPLDLPDADAKAKLDIHPELSGKMSVLHRLMDVMWKDQTPKKPPDKIVVISIYTQTLDLGHHCATFSSAMSSA